MPMTRTVFRFTTDTGGLYVDTGPPMNGVIWQIGTDTGLDTGCDFRLETVQSRQVISDLTNWGAGGVWKSCPRVYTNDTGGAVVGDQPPVIAGDQLRLRIQQSADVAHSKTGNFYVWVDEG